LQRIDSRRAPSGQVRINGDRSLLCPYSQSGVLRSWMTIWDGEYAFSIQAAFRSKSIALSHPVIRFQLALFWSTNLRSRLPMRA